MRNRPHRSAVQHNAHRSHVDVHVIAYLHRTAPWSAGAALEWTEAWPKGRLGVADAACYAQAVNRQNVGARAEARPPHHPRVGRHSSQAFRAAAERPASHHRVIAMADAAVLAFGARSERLLPQTTAVQCACGDWGVLQSLCSARFK